MDEQFRRIYEQQYVLYQVSQSTLLRHLYGPSGFRRLQETANQSLAFTEAAVATATKKLDLDNSIRSDARLFLIMNLHQMVTLPMSHRDAPTRFTPTRRKELTQDVEQILSAARNHMQDEEMISAAAIVRGTAQVLDTLNFKDWRLWARSRG